MAWPAEAGSIATAKHGRRRRVTLRPRSRAVIPIPVIAPALAISEGGQRPTATRADALRIEVSSVGVQHLHAVQTIPGVAILHAAGKNGPGQGSIRSTGDGTLLSWRAPGSSTYGDRARIAADATLLLEDGEDRDKFVRVQVFSDFLNPGHEEATVHMAEVYENGISSDDVTAGEASAGDISDFNVTLANDSNVGLSQVKSWIDTGTTGIEISDDDLTYVLRNAEENPLALADIPAGGTITFYLRRTITAGAPSDEEVLNLLHFRWEGL